MDTIALIRAFAGIPNPRHESKPIINQSALPRIFPLPINQSQVYTESTTICFPDILSLREILNPSRMIESNVIDKLISKFTPIIGQELYLPDLAHLLVDLAFSKTDPNALTATERQSSMGYILAILCGDDPETTLRLSGYYYQISFMQFQGR